MVEGDANFEIINFPDHSFDYVILSQTLQTVSKPKWVLSEILRIGKMQLCTFLTLVIGYAGFNFIVWKNASNRRFKTKLV